jgi:AcrR family transcriptional regulator
VASDARDRIILATEQLVAERGVDVPLRDIATAAGQRNNSAVQYYYGSREGLYEAVMQRRMATIGERMTALLADREGAPTDNIVADMVDTLIRPMIEVPYAEGSTHYARFLEQVRSHPVVAQLPNLEIANASVVRLVLARLDAALAALPTGLRLRRIRSMSTAMFALLADYERERAQRPKKAPATEEIVDMLVGILVAPVR